VPSRARTYQACLLESERPWRAWVGGGDGQNLVPGRARPPLLESARFWRSWGGCKIRARPCRASPGRARPCQASLLEFADTSVRRVWRTEASTSEASRRRGGARQNPPQAVPSLPRPPQATQLELKPWSPQNQRFRPGLSPKNPVFSRGLTSWSSQNQGSSRGSSHWNHQNPGALGALTIRGLAQG